MKKLIYLLVVGAMFAFTACSGGGETAVDTQEEVAVCSNTGEPCLADHSCCAAKEDAACCCGNVECTGECHTDKEGEAHDHSDGEDHGHDHSDDADHDHDEQ